MSQSSENQFGKYELLDRIAAGGMAEIFRARYAPAPGVTKQVVIKKILPHYAANKAFIAMFTNEARIAIGLSHGNIAQVFDFGAIDGEYFLAMELVDGQPLSKVLKRARTMGIAALPPEFAVFAAIEMLKGLQYAHARLDEAGRPLHIVHRDISPQNVLVSYEGQVKLVDFGIAKARNAGTEDTSSNAVKGKYAYFAPEQARGKDVDARTDVFATGIVLYELLTGQLPFQGKMMDVLSRIVRGLFPRPREVNPSIASELEAILLKAMAIEKSDRYATAEAFGLALSTWLSTSHPTFTSTQFGHLLLLLFEEDLVREGRPIKLPRDFVERARAWRGDATFPPSEGSLPQVSEPEFAEAISAEDPTEAMPVPDKPTESFSAARGERTGPTGQLPLPDTGPTVVPSPDLVNPPPQPARPASGKRRRPLPVGRAVALVVAACAVGFGAVFVTSRLARGTLEIVSVPPGAEVRIDDAAGTAPSPLTVDDLEGGRDYKVEVTTRGYRRWVNFVPLKRGQHLVVRAELEAEPPPPPPPRVMKIDPDPPKPVPPPPPPPPPLPTEVTWPKTQSFELDAARHHVDLSRAGVRMIALDPSETYKVWLSPGPTLGWGYYVVNPAGAQPGALGVAPLQMKGATRLFVFRLTAGTLGGGADEAKPRAVQVLGAGKKKPVAELVSGGMEIPPVARVRMNGLSPDRSYELAVTPGKPAARQRDTGAAVSMVSVGTASEGLQVAAFGAPVRITKAASVFVTLLDDEADVQEGRLVVTVKEVKAAPGKKKGR